MAIKTLSAALVCGALVFTTGAMAQAARPANGNTDTHAGQSQLRGGIKGSLAAPVGNDPHPSLTQHLEGAANANKGNTHTEMEINSGPVSVVRGGAPTNLSTGIKGSLQAPGGTDPHPSLTEHLKDVRKNRSAASAEVNVPATAVRDDAATVAPRTVNATRRHGRPTRAAVNAEAQQTRDLNGQQLNRR